ncbi:VOC family protein [Nocardia rosealba]|uniref:VOC family protein n=1 Tax=Nocardia rosealba TaxID=2878563 RepID=UPI001CD9F1F3|nr:VOC family protein [Nocardia rosealba]MCA2210944.1 glyoxalase [Nocardia rosealba]
MSDAAVPMLWSGDLGATLAFYRTLGWTVTHEQTRPYAYGVVEGHGAALHFSPAPAGVELPLEHVAALLLVDDVADRHAKFTAALRTAYGKIPVKGCPRITRFRPGQSRFTLVDPVGNTLLVIQRDEPESLEYGGSRELEGLPRVLDNARIFRDFKNDDRAATRALETGLRRFGATASATDLARAYAALAELAVAAGDSDRLTHWKSELNTLTLTSEERASLATDAAAPDQLNAWLSMTE